MMTNGQYLLADHDLPFSGHLGLTRFIVDFLLSPADLQVTDGLGLRTGNFGGQIIAEIPGSHPAYLVPGMYLLPEGTPLTRRIVGTGSGKYTFNTIMPSGAAVSLENVDTAPGQEDVLAINGDGTQIRFTPSRHKAFNLTLSRLVGDQVRAVAIEERGGRSGRGSGHHALARLVLGACGQPGRRAGCKRESVHHRRGRPHAVEQVHPGSQVAAASRPARRRARLEQARRAR